MLISQMEELATDKLPQRWIDRVRSLRQPSEQANELENEVRSATSMEPLQEWLEEVYFDNDKKRELSQEDVRELGHLIGRSSVDGDRVLWPSSQFRWRSEGHWPTVQHNSFLRINGS